jgi:NitT/TauT family transport system permease protein
MSDPRLRHWLLERLLPPLVLFVVVLGLWKGATVVRDIPAYLLPSPERVWQAAVGEQAELRAASWLTAKGACFGFLLSLMGGTLVACLFSQSRLVRFGCYPYAIFLQTVPIIAIAPLIITWFGFGFFSVVIVTFIISVFPILNSATTGLTSIDADLLDFFRLHDATRWQTLWKLRLPHAVPYIVTGAKTSSGAAVIGAIVGEYFAGFGSGDFGLGYLVFAKASQLKTDELFAVVIASTLLGVAIFGTVSLVGETILSRWSGVNDER